MSGTADATNLCVAKKTGGGDIQVIELDEQCYEIRHDEHRIPAQVSRIYEDLREWHCQARNLLPNENRQTRYDRSLFTGIAYRENECFYYRYDGHSTQQYASPIKTDDRGCITATYLHSIKHSLTIWHTCYRSLKCRRIRSYKDIPCCRHGISLRLYEFGVVTIERDNAGHTFVYVHSVKLSNIFPPRLTRKSNSLRTWVLTYTKSAQAAIVIRISNLEPYYRYNYFQGLHVISL